MYRRKGRGFRFNNVRAILSRSCARKITWNLILTTHLNGLFRWRRRWLRVWKPLPSSWAAMFRRALNCSVSPCKFLDLNGPNRLRAFYEMDRLFQPYPFGTFPLNAKKLANKFALTQKNTNRSLPGTKDPLHQERTQALSHGLVRSPLCLSGRLESRNR